MAANEVAQTSQAIQDIVIAPKGSTLKPVEADGRKAFF